MKNWMQLKVVAGIACLVFLGGVMAWTNDMPKDQKERDNQWAKVNDAINKGLPQTAIKEIEPIIQSALAEKVYPEAIKAIAKKIAYEGMIQGNKPEERITRMKAEIKKAPAEMVPTMEAILAEWYWHYFQQNRWRFTQRTATAAAPGEDFTTWDLPRIMKEIDLQFTKALSHEEKLKAIPVAQYNALLEKGTIPDSYRPTLFDFLAFEAMNFYTSGERAATKAEDDFEIEAASPVFGSVEEFLKWKPATTDADSPKLKAIVLFQKLLAFHQKDAEQSAFLDAELHRLRFAFNTSFGEEKKALYKKALKQYADAHAKHELSSYALHDLAAHVQSSEQDLVAAREIALQGKNRFPNSQGGMLCHNLIVGIETPSYQVHLERVWAPPQEKLHVEYRNMTKLHFRVYRMDWVNLTTKGNYQRAEYLNDQDRQAMMASKPAAQWSVELPATEDYQSRHEHVTASDDLAPGFYYLVSSPNADFNQNGPPVQFSHFWVTELSLVMRQDGTSNSPEGFVLNNKTGEPIAKAKVRSWTRNYQTNKIETGPEVETDNNGFFRVAATVNRPILLHVTANGQSLASQQEWYRGNRTEGRQTFEQTILFTDRAIYRPGQTVRFKGIVISSNQTEQVYKTIPNRNVEVIFADPNNKEISKASFVSTANGSFSGSFTAPRDRLMGRMTLRVNNPNGYAQVSVEEYKRPKFDVTLEAPTESPKLGGPVKLTGKALGYSGAAVSGAKLRYRVSREVRYPNWWGSYYWWRQVPQGTSQEIAHGSGMTEADGTFNINFIAKPDVTVAEKDEPSFNYVVRVDVTDTTGETRSSSRSVLIGYTALQATVTAENWQTTTKPVELKIHTETLGGEGQAAKGTLKVYRLKEPEKVLRASLLGRPTPRINRNVRQPIGKQPAVRAKIPGPDPDPADPRSWALGQEVHKADWNSTDKGDASTSAKLEVGIYRAVLESQDRFGKPIKAIYQFTVVDPAANKLAIKLPHLLTSPSWKLEPGQEFSVLWGTGYETGRAFVELVHRNKVMQSFWTGAGKTQHTITQAVNETLRGGFQLRLTYVRENRAYLETRHIDVPWTNKNLNVKWEHFVSKLEPGKKETWTAVITGQDAKQAVAEMVASLYDASLDAFMPHNWMRKIQSFYMDQNWMSMSFENTMLYMQHIYGHWPQNYQGKDYRYRNFPADITANIWQYMYYPESRTGRPGGFGGAGGGVGGRMAPGAAMPAMAKDASMDRADGAVANRAPALESFKAKKDSEGEEVAPATRPPVSPNLDNVATRANLSETAFFFPQLIADDNGTVKLEFTMPEALTKWKFLGFVHDKDLRSGFLEDSVVTAKDLMVQPNPPRFLREGDQIEFTVKVSNQSATKQAGKVKLTLADARLSKSIDEALGNKDLELPFEIPAKESRSFSWKLNVPDSLGAITYKAIGATDRLSDGEEGMLPVLSKRILVQESLPLPIRGKQDKTFHFKKLEESGKSNTIQHQSLTVQMVSNPSWYAVMALPYLMEYPHECSEQTFNRFYANTLAQHIARSDPKIRNIFNQWKNTPALDSPMEKNQDLKAVMLEETPWLRQANKESQSRRNVGILFDDNRLSDEMGRAFRKLTELQNATGAWSWFPGGPDNEYITLYITTGFGRLRHLGVKADMSLAIKSLNRLDAWMDRIYREILKHGQQDKNHLSSTVALYLYGRSFFIEDQVVKPQYKEAFDYWLGQAKKYWLQLPNRQSQGHLAIALKRWGSKDVAMDIMKSIKERSLNEEEMGRFWRDTELSFWWYHAPIETQALMIEAFDEVMNDGQAVEDCKVWLLKQKQTQNWKTTKSTADAVYSLLLRGDNLLKSDALVEMSLAGTPIKPEKVEAGTGFYEQKFVRGEIKPEFGKIDLKKSDAGVAWGSIHWQYLEDISKVTPHEATPLKLQKQLFKRTYTKKGPTLEAIDGAAAVGDEIVVRVVLRTDRDMEYVHMKDHRGSGTEPVNVLSRYKYQDGLGYYESTKDTASHFFIDYLPKGTYVFEYAVRVQLKGKYTTGMAHIECMYAPEFNSHSESIMLEVK